MSENQSKTEFDLIIIGGGPGGYVGAIRASQLGLKVAVVERAKMGGVCLNWGCIPTKALLQSAHLWREIQKAENFGLHLKPEKVDFPGVVKHSRKVADQMASGVDFLMKKNKITVISGEGVLKDKHTVLVKESTEKDAEDKKSKEKESTEKTIQELKGKYIILATGARPRPLPFLPFDGDKVLSSKEAMIQKEVPKTLAIIGAGAIGVEYADIYSSLGSEVTLIEALPHLLPNEDREISKGLERSFKKRKLNFLTDTKVLSAKVGNQVELEVQESDGSATKLSVEKVIVGIGIQPNTEEMGLETVGVRLSRGFVDIDKKNYRTTVDNIYAIGDCIQTPWLAHVASGEGIRAVEDISIREGNPHHLHFDILNYDAIPGCTYCHPEVASVGFTEEEAKKEGIPYDVGKIPFTANGKAQAMGDSEGFIKVLKRKDSGEILGAHILGANATELINEYVLAINSELEITDIARTVHAHPTVAETLMEAAESALGHAIHV